MRAALRSRIVYSLKQFNFFANWNRNYNLRYCNSGNLISVKYKLCLETRDAYKWRQTNCLSFNAFVVLVTEWPTSQNSKRWSVQSILSLSVNLYLLFIYTGIFREISRLDLLVHKWRYALDGLVCGKFETRPSVKADISWYLMQIGLKWVHNLATNWNLSESCFSKLK